MGAIIATAAVALAIAAVPVFLLKPAAPRPTPTPGVTVAQGPLRFVPDPGPGRRAIAADISRFLEGFYKEVFTANQTGASATPTPAPSVRFSKFFAARARGAVDRHADVFGPGADVDVSGGRVTFDGMVAMAGRRPAQAFVAVRFRGNGQTRGAPVVVTHRGNVLLIRSEQGWLIAGFDMKLDETAVTPSPSPTER